MSGAAAFDHPLLRAATPAAWIAEACALPEVLLIDHANCEKKAASTALAMMFAYAEDLELTDKMSRLAREELRHYEQVAKLLLALKIAPQRLAPGRYAARLRRLVASGEPRREVDLMVCGAFIEARSCERFAALGSVIGQPLNGLFRGLHEAEARHYQLYLDLGKRAAARAGLDVDARIAAFAACEAELITQPDPVFRFHSGPPPHTGRRRTSAARQRLKLGAVPIPAQHAALIVPISQDDPGAGAPVHLEGMNARPMGMAVQQRRGSGAAQRRRHAAGVDVRDGMFHRGGVRLTAGAGGTGERAARFDRQRQKPALPVGISHRGAQPLVGMIVGAQRIAVHRQYGFPEEGDDQGVVQQLRAARFAEAVRQQKIAVAVHHEAGHAARGEFAQPGDGRRLRRVRRIIADPGFEQVTQNVQGGGVPGLGSQERQELLDDRRLRRVDMQIRDEERGHRGFPGRWAPRVLERCRRSERARSSG